MRIPRNTFAVFWSPAGATEQFHADVRALSPAAALQTFRTYFPTDTVRSVRGADGRFARLN